MALGFAAASANSMLDTWGAGAGYVQLHTGDPGASGTANVAGNSTRKAIGWSAASGGSMASSGAVDWTDGEVTTSEDYTHASFWSASSGGTFRGSGTITADAVNASGNSFRLNSGYTVSLNVAA